MGKGRWHSNAGMNGFPEKFGRQESSRLEDMESTIYASWVMQMVVYMVRPVSSIVLPPYI